MRVICRALQVVASLQAQLEQRRKEAEQRDLLFRNLTQETENLKNQLATVSTRCKTLETQVAVGRTCNNTQMVWAFKLGVALSNINLCSELITYVNVLELCLLYWPFCPLGGTV